MKKLLTFLTLLTLFFTTVSAATKTATLTSSNLGLTSSYTTKTVTVENISYSYSNLMRSTSSPYPIQAAANSGLIYNTTAYPGDIVSVAITHSGTARSTTISGSSNGTDWTEVATGSGSVTGDFSGKGYKYFKITRGANAAYWTQIVITYEEGGSTPEPTTYSLTLPTGLTGGTVTSNYSGDLTKIASGTSITVTATPATGYTLEYMKANGVNVENPFTFAIEGDTEITASFVQEQASTTEWVLTTPSALKTGDIILIVDKYSSRAMSNDNGTSAAPSATSVTLNTNKDKVTAGVTAALQWEVTKTDNAFNFTVPNGTTHLYCTNTNNGVRVGTNANQAFTINNDYLYNTATSRYLGVYNNQDWRCYDNTTGNIANTEIAFYKKVETGSHSVNVGTITGEGTITPSSTSANTGDVITVTATPATGYELTALAYNGTAIDITSTPYTFTMPDADVTLTATFSLKNYVVAYEVTPSTAAANSGNRVGLISGAPYDDQTQASYSKMGTLVTFKLYTGNGWQIDDANVRIAYTDANGNPATLTPTKGDTNSDDGGYGTYFTFTMPSSDVMINAAYLPYQPDLYILGNVNGGTHWNDGGLKMTFDPSANTYSIRIYASEENGYFRFYANGGNNGNPSYGAGGVNQNPLEGTQPKDLWKDGDANFCVPAGIYDIVVGQIYDDPTTNSNPNWWGQTTVTVTKVEPTFTFNPADGSTVYQGTNVTVTSNLYDLLHAINSEITESSVTNEVSLDGTTFSSSVALDNTGSATVTGKATYGYIDPTATANYTVNEIPAGSEYTLVTDASELGEGIEYVIMDKASGEGHAMSTTQNSNNRGQTELISIVNNKIIPTEDTQIITLEAATGGWYLNVGTGYLYAISSSNHLKTGTNLNSSDQYYVANITIGSENNVASIEFGTPTPRYIKHNSGSSIFSCYTSGQQEVYLFKKGVNNKSAAPVITPESGNIVGFSQEVEITQANGGTIYYTTDGTTPDENSTPYNGKFWVQGNLGDVVTVIAVAKETGKELSNTVTVNYKFVAPAAPVFTPGAGTYTTPQTVTVSSTTEGADVYYTATSGLSAAQIVAQGTKFEEPFTVSTPATYYAVTVYHDAHADRDALSGIRQAQYKFSEVESVDLPYSHPFTGGTGFGEFTTLDVNNPDEITVWTVSDDFGAKGTSFTSNPNTNHAATSWLLSPYINLGDAEEPVLTFDHQINKFFTNPSTQATVWIRTYGGEWTQLTTKLPTSSSSLSSSWTSFDQEYDLSAYNRQIVQIGFKYDNPTAGSGAGTWEIQNFLVADNAPIMVENIAEYLALPIGTNNITFKNPVTVQYHYISSTGKSYIYVKDDSGCAYFHQPADGETINQLANGDIIAGGFTGNKVADEMVSDEESNFAMFTDLENFAPNGDKGLADPEHETVARIADATTGVALNNHYITIKKVKLSALYKPEDVTYGNPLYFDIDNEAHIGYNKFNIDWSVVDDLDAYYNITGIQTAYNNVMEFHPTEIVKWEESVVTLRQLCDEGVTTAGENEYTISNNLMCVFAKDNSIWVKDDTGQSIWMTSPAESDANFEVYAEDAEGIDANTRLNQAYYDQSNWCEIKLAAGVDASQFKGKIIKGGTIHGEFTDKTNPTLENVTLTSAAISSEGDYALNYYMPANFLGRQKCYNPNHSTDFGQFYFFMTPKPQEYAQIVWAVWDASSTSMIMSTDDNRNGHRFAGEFEIDLSMNDGASSYSDIQNGATYNFTAILRKVSGSGSKAASDSYKVYPLDLNGQNPATGINTVETGNGEVKSVKFYNVAGIESATPFQGVNIVVTEYTDGSRTTSKMLRK